LQSFIEEEIKRKKKKEKIDLEDKKLFPVLDKKVINEEDDVFQQMQLQ
jgi:hemerythrin-like domain-containing protein